MSLLTGLRVAQIGPGMAAAVCGRLLADTGATVTAWGSDPATPLCAWLDHGKASGSDALAEADVVIVQGGPAELAARGHDPASIRRINRAAPIVAIGPFGQSGPQKDDPATDLTLFFASGIARLLTGQVDDLSEPPIRPVGEQSAFLGGVAAACAGMQAVLSARTGVIVDVSVQEALATLAMTELSRAGLHGRSWARKRVGDGNGATVCILPARDGYVAISPREDRQWASWLTVMGSPTWSNEARFRTKADRASNFDALHQLMSAWSSEYDKQWIADRAQAAHVPSFPLREPSEQLRSQQLHHRRFYRPIRIDGQTIQAPGAPFGLTVTEGTRTGALQGRPTPLSGVRVLDFSWVIAGPTATRYLAAMGAEVIKIEAPGRGDPGRASELHTVLGQAKKAIVLDLKQPAAVEIARNLAARADVVIENYATGVMDRLGLGPADLKKINPRLIYVSASGLGRTGPEARAVAYGTLLQCYAGFAGLNRHPGHAPRVGLAWLDPMCGLMLAFIVAAGLWQRQTSGGIARVDFSMIEAMLWTMAEPLLATQLGVPPQPMGNDAPDMAPHGVWRCAGDDDWLAVATTTDRQWRSLCGVVPDLASLSGYGLKDRQQASRTIGDILAAWAGPQTAAAAEARLIQAGVPAAALARSRDLVASPHLQARGFWDQHPPGVLPGLPWRASFGRAQGPAPDLGADTVDVLRAVLGLPDDRIQALREAGALG